MPEEILFKTEQEQSQSEIATYLRQVAEKLDAGGEITLRSGDQSVTLSPPARPTFEVKAEREGPVDGDGELSIELELEWDENGGESRGDSGQLEIE